MHLCPSSRIPHSVSFRLAEGGGDAVNKRTTVNIQFMAAYPHEKLVCNFIRPILFHVHPFRWPARMISSR